MLNVTKDKEISCEPETPKLRGAEAPCCAPIDCLRRQMIESGLSSEDAGMVVGLAAEYAQRAYMQGYNRGWAAGVAKHNDKDEVPK